MFKGRLELLCFDPWKEEDERLMWVAGETGDGGGEGGEEGEQESLVGMQGRRVCHKENICLEEEKNGESEMKIENTFLMCI